MSYHYLFFFALINVLILMAALLWRKENWLPNLLLAAILGAALYVQWIQVLNITGEIERYPFLLGTRFPAKLLVPPLFYLYVLALTIPGFKWSPRHWLHFLPFLFAMISYLVWAVYSENGPQWRESRSFYLQHYGFLLIAMSVTAVYWIPCFRQLRRFQQLIPYYFSDLIRVRLLWLQVMLGLFLVPWLIGLVDLFIGPRVALEKLRIPVLTGIIFLIGFFGFRQKVIFSRKEAWQPTPEDLP